MNFNIFWGIILGSFLVNFIFLTLSLIRYRDVFELDKMGIFTILFEIFLLSGIGLSIYFLLTSY